MPIVVYSHKEGGYGDLMFALKTAASLKETLKRDDIILVVSEDDQKKIRELEGDKEFKVDVLSEDEFQQATDISSIDCIIEGPLALKGGGAVCQGRLGDIPKSTPILICSEYSCDHAGRIRTEGVKDALKMKGYHNVRTLYSGPDSSEMGVWIDESLLSASKLIKSGDQKSVDEAWQALGNIGEQIRGSRDIQSYGSNVDLALQYSAQVESIHDFIAIHYALSDPASPRHQDIVCIIGKEKEVEWKLQLDKIVIKHKDKLKKDGFTKIVLVDLAGDKVPPENEMVIPLIDEQKEELSSPAAEKIYRIIRVDKLNHSQMKAMLLLSKGIVGITGDQSQVEAICAGQIPVYETLKHKVGLANNLHSAIDKIAKKTKHFNSERFAMILYHHDKKIDYVSHEELMIIKKKGVEDILAQLHEKKSIRSSAQEELRADLLVFAEEQRTKFPIKMRDAVSDAIRRKDLKIEIRSSASLSLPISPLSSSRSTPTPLTPLSSPSPLTPLSSRSPLTPLSTPSMLISRLSPASHFRDRSYSAGIGKRSPQNFEVSIAKTIDQITVDDIKLYQDILAKQGEQKNVIKIRRKDKLLQRANLPSIINFPPDKGFYILSDTIGKGGWGRVKKAYYCHPELGIQQDAPVAIKIENEKDKVKVANEYKYFLKAHSARKSDKVKYQCFKRKSQKSPYIPPTMKIYSMLPYLPGVSLDKFLEDKKEVPFDERLKVAKAFMKALSELHSKNIVHLDIKPQNIMYDAKTGEVHIVDFGCAEVKNTEIKFVNPKTGKGKFDEPYTAPEFGRKFNGSSIADPSMDIYSSAILIAEIMGIPLAKLIMPKLKKAEIQASDFSESYDSAEGIRRLEVFMGSNEYDFTPIKQINENLYHLLISMTSNEPEKRPQALKVCEAFEKLSASADVHVQDDFRPSQH